MKYLNTLTCLSLISALLLFSSCEEDGADPDNARIDLEVQMAEDIPADPNVTRGPDGSTPPPRFTFFNLSDGEIVDRADSASTRWDIALAGTTILVNGGTSGPGQGAAQVVNGTFEDLTEAPETGYASDQGSELAIPSGSGNGWYTYTGEGNPPAAILPIPGRIIVLQTADGNYAKMEILSYYEGNPDTSTGEFANFQTRPAGRHYTFQYVVQPDGSRNF